MATDVRERLDRTMSRAWNDLLASIDGLTEEEMRIPGVTGDWSVADVLAHITTWENEALAHLPAIAQGKPQQRYKDVYGGIDAFNALSFEKDRSRSVAEIRQRLISTHQALLDYLATVPEDVLHSRQRFRTRLRWDTYSHYPMHAEAIRAWRARNDGS